MSSLKFWQQEEDNLLRLRKLYSIIEHISSPTSSQLDPFRTVRKSAVLLQKYLKAIVDKYPHFLQLLRRYEDPSSAVKGWLFQLNALGFFANILIESTNLILSPDVSYFREGPSSNFTTFVFDIYTQLRGYANLLDKENASHVMHILTNFEERFRKMYMFENYNTTRYDEVRDLMSMNHSLVASLPIKNESISRKAYFQMRVNDMFQTSLLVELCELIDTGIAIFKVESGELPSTIGNAQNLVDRLVRGEYSLLHFGKSLLFPVIKKGDLKIMRNVRSGYELKTVTANGTELKLTSVDPIQWETYWSFSFQKLFRSSVRLENTIPTDTERIQRVASSSDFKFLKKYDKLDSNPFKSVDDDGSNVIGMGIGISSGSTKDGLPGEPDANVSRNSSGFSLHKSNPLPKSMDQYIKKDTTKYINPFKETFHDHMEGYGNEAGEDATKIETENMTEDHPTHGKVSIKLKDSKYEEGLSNKNDKMATEYKESMVNMSTKSSVSNGTCVTQDTLDISDGSFTDNNKIKPENSIMNDSLTKRLKTVNINDEQTPITEFEHYIHEFVRTDSEPLFRDLQCVVSIWNGSTWEVIEDDNPLQLTIIVLKNKLPILIYSQVDDILNPVFAISVGPHCRSGAATARDIQLRVTKTAYIIDLPSYSSTLNIRTVHSRELLAIIQECVSLGTNTYEKYLPISKSTSVGSSILDNTSASSADTQLVSKIKVKLHILKNGVWRPSSIGSLDISINADTGGPGFLFEYRGADNLNTKIDSRKKIIGRLGRTGIALTSNDSGHLFEFTNQSVTDDICRLLNVKPKNSNES